MLKKYILFYAFLLKAIYCIDDDNFLINTIYKGHNIEIYNSLDQSYNDFNIALELGLKQIIAVYNTIFSMQQNFLYKAEYIKRLYNKIILLKNENISIKKKIIKLFSIIKNSIPEKKDQDFILKIYKKFLSIFL
jgi:hypothetical protein